MADEPENDDQWLYGENLDSQPPPEAPREPSPKSPDPPEPDEPENAEPAEERQPQTEPQPKTPETKEDGESDNEGKQNGEGSDKEDFEEDSDDDVNVVIGDIKTSPAYSSLNIKRGGLLTSAGGDKSKQPQQTGKFTVEEFEQTGMINGVPAAEFNLDSLEDKPWRKPGADITDYFNYGFNEDTWRAYCERQKRLRVNESGVGLAPLNAIGLPRGPLPIMNDNSKYSGNFMGLRKAGPPPGRRITGSIDVIGGAAQRIDASGKLQPVKENVIQVMTADRREYSRKPPGFPDMSVPPPTTFEEFQPEFGFNPEPEPFYGGYEPTQDVQWGTEPDMWPTPQEIKPLTGGVPAISNVPPPGVSGSPVVKDGSPSRDKDREHERSRGEKRERDRERSHRRERSRSRSRRHKSRSRSPSHRSHRKKKSRRHDESD